MPPIPQYGGKSLYTDGTPDFRPQMVPDLLWRDIGSSGLRQYGGWVREEFLRALQGREAARVFREMRDNSPTIGALMFAILQTMRKIDWKEETPDDTGEQNKYTDFAHSLRHDMSESWEDFIAEALSMLEFGFAPHEIVYKRRNGRKPSTAYGAGGGKITSGDDAGSSKYEDGLIGIRRLPLRGQETILRWYFDPNGQVTGMQQQPWQGPLIDLPIEKLLIFRPMHYKGNPEGRALDPETMIPTPEGWRRLDDIVPGSKVFDESGRVRYVTARADWYNRPCYAVKFNDGSEIIADCEHQWITQTLTERTARKTGKLRTTADLAKSVVTKMGSSNHSIEWTSALDYPVQELVLDPYLLGLWLGDGTTLSSQISCHLDDVEETVALINECGYSATVSINGKSDNGRLLNVQGCSRWDSQGPQALLTALGLRGNKYIPLSYMRGSIDQRRDLLAGLMDSDGSVDVQGRCEFTNCNYGLCQGVVELIRSLGCGAFVGGRHKANGRDRKSDSWIVRFTPPWSPFRLKRKTARVKFERTRNRHYINAVELVDNRRTVCLEVDGLSHMFLAGENMVPTHNSILRNSYRPYFFSKRIEEDEAILFERMNGLPVLHVPAALLENAKTDPNAQATLEYYKKLVTNTRIDEQMGVILPSDTFQNANGYSNVRMYEFQLLTPTGGAGTRVDADKVLGRYSLDILKTAMADFIDLGHQARGTQNLAISKVDMFFQAISGYLNSMAGVMNKYMLPRVWDLNGWSQDTMPNYVPDLAQRIDLDVISNFVLRLSQAGARLFPDDNLENYLREAAGMPSLDEDADYKPLQGLVNPASQVIPKPVQGTPTGGAGAGGPLGKTAGSEVADAILYEVAREARKHQPAYRVQGAKATA